MKELLTSIGWPTVVLLLGGMFLLLFRKPIANLLERTKKLSRSGLETVDAAQLPAAKDAGALQEFMKSFDNPLLAEQEARIRADLKARKLDNPPDVQIALVRALAGTQILLYFESAQATIWASQVSVLTYLNSRPGPAPISEIQPFYDAARAQYPDLFRQYPLDGYLRFLESYYLLKRDGDTLEITLAGREFLKWRIEARKVGPFHG